MRDSICDWFERMWRSLGVWKSFLDTPRLFVAFPTILPLLQLHPHVHSSREEQATCQTTTLDIEKGRQTKRLRLASILYRRESNYCIQDVQQAIVTGSFANLISVTWHRNSRLVWTAAIRSLPAVGASASDPRAHKQTM